MAHPVSDPKLPKQDPFLVTTLAISLAVLLAAGLVLGLAGPPAYRWFKIQRFLSVARENLEKGDYSGALFFTSQVLQRNPKNDEAVELVARILLAQNQPTAVLWIAEWAELDPKDPHRLLTLGKLCLTQNNPKAARTCLEAAKKLPDASKEDLVELEAGLLVREGKLEAALELLGPAAQGGGAEEPLQQNYANLLLLSPNSAQKAEGVARLKMLAASGKNAAAARRSLLLYAVESHDKALARETADSVQASGLKNAPDLFLWAGTSLLLDNRLPGGFLEQAKEVASKQPAALAEMTVWLLSRKLVDAAIALSEAHLDQPRFQPGVWPLHATCLAAAGKWDFIRETFTGQDWGKANDWRLFYLLQAARPETGSPELRNTDPLWYSLQIQIKQSAFDVPALDRQASSWGWNSQERLRLWKLLDEAKPMPMPFLVAELKTAQSKQDTTALYGISRQILRKVPDEKAAVNNTATYGLLLGADIEENAARVQALVSSHPEDTLLKTALALAFLRQHRPAEALGQFEGLNEQDLERPDIAAYYAAVLQANGKNAEAAPFRALAAKAKLLPEEKALLEQSGMAGETNRN